MCWLIMQFVGSHQHQDKSYPSIHPPPSPLHSLYIHHPSLSRSLPLHPFTPPSPLHFLSKIFPHISFSFSPPLLNRYLSLLYCTIYFSNYLIFLKPLNQLFSIIVPFRALFFAHILCIYFSPCNVPLHTLPHQYRE